MKTINTQSARTMHGKENTPEKNDFPVALRCMEAQFGELSSFQTVVQVAKKFNISPGPVCQPFGGRTPRFICFITTIDNLITKVAYASCSFVSMMRLWTTRIGSNLCRIEKCVGLLL